MNSEKKDSFEILIGKLEHDLHKPLNNLKMFLKILPMKATDSEFINQATAEIEKSLENPILLVERLKQLLKEKGLIE
ncbi:MAG: hypothetical protein COW00_05190 [Bdellovibrio sp. CG12_big_fil_rev_8_21_14_0_65_39_13]|nr:MAG: hypothetical protein COW78_13390 [Bdellovibrio sp. CG22_combo_CG10-13_8_21_14_all_39_27]PIQ61204.1 MAG: hypothetical protein COW00_05190 [Bdellovibrio sp. CG12_big_fil_rev_8_21_14_0_65_39_13]PIR34874.1 MAG: hypothetical protein COV37_11465 [Bdellovibrio sp. CG11_big_fil_rev_8_21_14_0_20_39_38]PJB54672.1 MAG: hypothetical protein CO099_00255 [Bdellovibrio sp. CG_4_9_14_3_um_filter_39_7]